MEHWKGESEEPRKKRDLVLLSEAEEDRGPRKGFGTLGGSERLKKNQGSVEEHGGKQAIEEGALADSFQVSHAESSFLEAQLFPI